MLADSSKMQKKLQSHRRMSAETRHAVLLQVVEHIRDLADYAELTFRGHCDHHVVHFRAATTRVVLADPTISTVAKAKVDTEAIEADIYAGEIEAAMSAYTTPASSRPATPVSSCPPTPSRVDDDDETEIDDDVRPNLFAEK